MAAAIRCNATHEGVHAAFENIFLVYSIDMYAEMTRFVHKKMATRTTRT